jgi:hypothetical protein
MQIQSVSSDYYTCHTYDGDNEGDADIKVANPYGFTKEADDEIYAVRGFWGGSQVEDAPVWMDIGLGPQSGGVYNCKAATTGNQSLTGHVTVDGVSVSTGHKVLVWQQTTASENGVYEVPASGAWTKLTGFTDGADLMFWVSHGTLHAETAFGITGANAVKGCGAFYK